MKARTMLAPGNRGAKVVWTVIKERNSGLKPGRYTDATYTRLFGVTLAT